MNLRQPLMFLKAFGVSLALFASIYFITFSLAILLSLKGQFIVLFVIVSTLAISLFVQYALTKLRNLTFSDFGFVKPGKVYLVKVLVLAIPIAFFVTWTLKFAHETNPLADVSFSTWQLILYFGVLASLQEEIIFRGLLQTVFIKTGNNSKTLAAILIAVLFAVIHLEVGPLTALGALVLGMMAGYFRNHSKSIWPSVLAHAVFNLFSVLWY